MRKIVLAAALALAACGQPATKGPDTATAPPAALMDQVLAMAPEEQPVFAYQQLAAYQAAHPDSLPKCTAVRGSEARGAAPADVDPNSVYAPYAGAQIYSVQCGALISATRYDPHEHWIVIFQPGATEVVVVNCGDAAGDDQCPRPFPHAAAPTTTTTP